MYLTLFTCQYFIFEQNFDYSYSSQWSSPVISKPEQSFLDLWSILQGLDFDYLVLVFNP